MENKNRLFESRKVLASTAAIPNPDAKIIFTKAPFNQYEQILLDKNFGKYLETITVSNKILRMGAQKTPTQKTYEMNVGHESLGINFLGLQRHFDWIELSIVYDKSNKHNIQQLQHWIGCKNHKIDHLTQKHLLYNQFVVCSCNGCSTAPSTDYINNPVYLELIDEGDYFGSKSDERIYLDLRASSGYTNEAEKVVRNNSKINLYILLKSAATKKLRLRGLGSFHRGRSIYISKQCINPLTYSICYQSRGPGLFRMRERQSVRKDAWYLRGRRRRGLRKRRQKGGAFPIDLLGSIAAQFICENANPISKKNIGGRRQWDKTYC